MMSKRAKYGFCYTLNQAFVGFRITTYSIRENKRQIVKTTAVDENVDEKLSDSVRNAIKRTKARVYKQHHCLSLFKHHKEEREIERQTSNESLRLFFLASHLSLPWKNELT